MAFRTLLTEKRGPAFIITINRPEVLNALNANVIEELEQVIQEFHKEDVLRAAIIIGAGEKAFVAGADIAGINALENEDAALALSKRGQNLFDLIESGNKPVIAAINGFALGGGCELAMACHIRIASDNARFGQPEVKLGLIAGYGGTQRLPRLIGRGKATELLLTGDMMNAHEALEWGLVDHVVSLSNLLDIALGMVDKISKVSPTAVALTLKSISNSILDPANGLADESRFFAYAASNRDGKEGTKAFLEKRSPNFSKAIKLPPEPEKKNLNKAEIQANLKKEFAPEIEKQSPDTVVITPLPVVEPPEGIKEPDPLQPDVETTISALEKQFEPPIEVAIKQESATEEKADEIPKTQHDKTESFPEAENADPKDDEAGRDEEDDSTTYDVRTILTELKAKEKGKKKKKKKRH